ncbi:MAG: PKD domain-containing protein, partial [Nanoarchaeota archaeon]|nr:PKD domain-containing protein [Nanoarchaeota archaeon]
MADKMKKVFLLLQLILLFLISSVFASAAAYYTANWYYNSVPVTNVRAINYICNDAGCNTLGTELSDDTSATNSITVSYPIPSPTYGYATYWFADCYKYMELAWKPTSSSSYSYNVDFTKYSNCQAAINTFSAPLSVDENQPVQATGNIQSALSEEPLAPWGEPSYTDIVQNFLSAQTAITVTIVNGSGSVVFAETKQDYILRDTSNNVSFSSWTPDYNQSGNYTITLTTTVPDCKCGNQILQQQTRTLTVNDVNLAPQFDEVLQNQTAIEDQSFTYDINCSDADGDTLIYFDNSSLFNIDPATGLINFIPTNSDVGAYDVEIICSDGAANASDRFTLTVQNVNDAPVLDFIGDKTVNENQLLQFVISATDVDNFTLIYSALNLPAGAIFNPATRIFSWVPDYNQSGIYAVIFNVTDGELYDYEAVNIAVSDVNRAPTAPIVLLSPAVAYKSTQFNCSASGSIDLDGDAVSYIYTFYRLGAILQDWSAVSIYTCGVNCDKGNTIYCDSKAYDGMNYSNTVTSNGVTIQNSAPFFNPLLQNQTAIEDQLFDYDVNCSDLDGDPITYTDNSTLFVIGSATGLISFTPANADVGIYNTTINCFDGSSITTANFVLTVQNVNDAPVLDFIGNKTVDENQLLQFQINSTDVDNVTLIYSALNLPAGAIFNPATRIFSWVPDYNQSGNYVVIFNVTDGELYDYEAVNIAVSDVNRQPVANSDGPYNMDEGSTIVLNASLSSDPDNDPLIYLWDFDNDGIYGDASGVLVNYANNANGTYTIGLNVSDGGLSSLTNTLVIVNDLGPTANATDSNGITLDNYAINAGQALNASGLNSKSFPDTIVSYIWQFGDGTASSSATATKIYNLSGIYRGNLTVTDSDSSKDIDVFDIIVGCVDNDGDGYNSTGGNCGPIDCNDANTSINPGATEICNGIDDNCDTQIDEGVQLTFYRDFDTDTYGN